MAIDRDMMTDESIAVRRPRRWDEPMDPHMTDADVGWLREQSPFSNLDPAAFPKSIPLDGILRNDCRLHRFAHGEVIAREGDYANSAFLLVDGHAELLTRELPPELLGRRETEKVSWPKAVWQLLRPSGVREARRPEEVVPNVGIAHEKLTVGRRTSDFSDRRTDPWTNVEHLAANTSWPQSRKSSNKACRTPLSLKTWGSGTA